MRMDILITAGARIAARTVRDGECLRWTGAKNQFGYGRIGVGFRNEGTKDWMYVHRVAWILANGPIPEGLVIDHLCRVPDCANVDHMEVVTRQENTLRGNTIPAANAAKTHCPRCGGDYTSRVTKATGRTHRYCKPCFQKISRDYGRAKYVRVADRVTA